ncbi:MAG: TonB-dependent receptor [Bryobacterales bacterium]|nr:TonB-dependent receptor [Bryobacterales bacterium]
MRVIRVCKLALAVLAAGAFTAGPALNAQDNSGTVLGFVYDASTGNAIPQVDVEMTGEVTVTATTTIEGSFTISDVPAGTYTVIYKSANHQAVNVEGLEVLAGEIADASTVMSSKGETTVVDVVAKVAASVATQEAMLVERKLASTVSDTISAEEIRGGTSSDASEAIEKVTGVTTMNDFVFVRGLDPRYSGTTLNNALLASTEPERRVVPLDLFPASLIDSIKVQKTYAPDLPGEFSAGLVQVETTEFPTRPTLSVSYSIGYNTQTQGRTFLDYPGGGRDFFGFDDGSRALPDSIPADQRVDRFTFSRSELQEFGHAFSNNWERVPYDLSRPSMSWSAVAGNTFGKLGIVGALTFSNSLQSIFDQQRNFYLPNPQAALGAANAGPPVLASEFDYDESTESVRLGGVVNVSYQFTPANKISLKNFFSRDTDDETRHYEGFYQDFNTDIRNQRLRYIERTIQNSQLEGEHLFAGLNNAVFGWTMSYSKATRNEPDLRESLQIYQPRTDSFIFFDDSQSAFRMFTDLDETILNPSVDMLVPFYRGGFSGAVKFGANYSSRGRHFRSRRFRYNLRSSRGIDLMLGPNDLFSEDHIRPRGFELNETTRVTDAYRGVRDVFGYYGMLELNFAARWRLIGGLRIEDVNQDVTTFNQFLPATGREPAPFTATNYLPALNVIYSMTPKQNLRVGYSQTVSRPDFRELARFGFLDVVGGLQTIGNPELVQTDISNYDVRWEYFPGGNQLLAASFFFKNFNRPIERTMISAVALLRTFSNANAARNYGFEFEFRRGMNFLSPKLREFALSSNFTLVDSNIDLENVDKSLVLTSLNRPMQGQSRYVANVIGEWARPKARSTARFYVNYFSSRITDVGAFGLPDVLQDGLATMDFVYEYTLKGDDRWKLRFAAENLNNARWFLTQGGETFLAYREGRTITVGTSFRIF